MLQVNIGRPLLTRLEHLGIPLMRRLLICNKSGFNVLTIYILKVCVIQKQVPLPLPCVNFAQITISSLTNQQITISAILHAMTKRVHKQLCINTGKLS